MKTTQAVAIVHSDTDVPGSLPTLFDEQGIELKIIPISQGLPAPAALDLVVVMGSPESAYDMRLAWLENELTWLRAVQARGVPTLGICFGSQLLARALGGEVYRSTTAEIGWTELQTFENDWAHRGPWLNFHFDTFTLPPGATLLAKTDIALQAYRQGRSLGVQFHPEIDTQMFDTWTDYWRNTAQGQTFLASAGDLPDRIRAEIQQKQAGNQDNCRRLLGDFLSTL